MLVQGKQIPAFRMLIAKVFDGIHIRVPVRCKLSCVSFPSKDRFPSAIAGWHVFLEKALEGCKDICFAPIDLEKLADGAYRAVANETLCWIRVVESKTHGVSFCTLSRHSNSLICSLMFESRNELVGGSNSVWTFSAT